MNKELIELRGILIERAKASSELANELHSDYYSARADAFCTILKARC